MIALFGVCLLFSSDITNSSLTEGLKTITFTIIICFAVYGWHAIHFAGIHLRKGNIAYPLIAIGVISIILSYFILTFVLNEEQAKQQKAAILHLVNIQVDQRKLLDENLDSFNLDQ